ncbi:MAG: signal peptidase I [Acidimicrobiales bacterium]
MTDSRSAYSSAPSEAPSREPAPAPHAARPAPGAASDDSALEPEARVSSVGASHSRRLVEWAVVVLVAVIVAAGLRAFVVQTFYVPTGSMMPTLQIGDRIIVLKVGYSIHRGDILVFRRTPADTYTTDADLVKRVVGMPGETITSRGDTVLINGKAIKEPWLPVMTTHMTAQGAIDCTQSAFDIPTTKIPANHYFVMGDCRGDSEDSRAWGTVPASYIIGKVVVIVWRFGHPWFRLF